MKTIQLHRIKAITKYQQLWVFKSYYSLAHYVFINDNLLTEK